MDILTPQTKLETNDILFVGFDNYFYKSIVQNSGADVFSHKLINNPFRAFNWLQKQVIEIDRSSHPVAIVCELNFLLEDNYILLKNIKKHDILKNIPFIVIATDKKDLQGFDKVSAIKKGIDDCYTLPVKWSNIRKRIEFLNRFKTDLLKTNPEGEAEEFGYKIPRGKRIFDIVFASAVLLAISPLLILVAILVKLESKGNIFYYSKRAGNGYNVFDFIKFRSMCQGADAKLVQLAHLNQYSNGNQQATTAGSPSFVKLKNDPRVTRIGKIIRKTSIDELPQLLNVLKGDMSIVGNRPLPLYEAEQLTKDDWVKRFQAPAGLTGLWQVTKRGTDDMSTDERISLDITYAEKYSMWMDLKIILKTLPAMIQKEQV